MAATARPRSTTARKRAAKYNVEKIKQEDLAVVGGASGEEG